MTFIKAVEEAYVGITNRQRLNLLKHWLDEASAANMEAELETNPELQYELYWARLDLGFGGQDGETLRRQMRATRLTTRGKLSEREWRDYATRVSTLARQIGDVTEVEIGRKYIEDLPAHPWRRKIIEQQEKNQSQSGALVLKGFPQGTTAGDVEALVTMETGIAPLKVLHEGDKFKVQSRSTEQREQVMAVFDRQALACGATIAVSPGISELTGPEVDQLMLRWLRIDSKVNMAAPRDTDTTNAYGREAPPYRRLREVQAEDDGTELEVEVAAVREGKGKGKGEKSKITAPPSSPATTPPTPSPAPAPPSTPQQPQPSPQQSPQSLQPQSSTPAGGKGGWQSSGYDAWRSPGKGGWQNNSQEWRGGKGRGWRAQDDDWRYDNRSPGGKGKGRPE